MNKNIRFPQKEKQPKKLIRAMKFFLLFALLTTGSCFASETYSQEASFSMNYENKTIKEIINEIENNSEFIFFCMTKLLQKSEMRKEIVIELSYKGFSRASDYS